MSGKKQFDEEKVLESAMRIFWEKGYSATSLSDLESATGLNKSSIYNAFKNKEGLYSRTLELHRKKYIKMVLVELENDDFKTAMRNFVASLNSGYDNPNWPKGCLVTLAAIEMGGKDGLFTDVISTGLEDMISGVEKRCKIALKDNQLKAGTDCRSLASMIIAVSRGVIILNMGTGNNVAGKQAYDSLISLIENISI